MSQRGWEAQKSGAALASGERKITSRRGGAGDGGWWESKGEEVDRGEGGGPLARVPLHG